MMELDCLHLGESMEVFRCIRCREYLLAVTWILTVYGWWLYTQTDNLEADVV